MTREDAIDILMVSTGLSEERIEELARVISGQKQFSKSAIRMRRHRAKLASHGDAGGASHSDAFVPNSLKNNNQRHIVTHKPLQTLRSKKEVRVGSEGSVGSLPPGKSPPAVVAPPSEAVGQIPPTQSPPLERLVLGENDFCSDDGKIVITAEMFTRLQEEFPEIKNIRGMVRHACRKWLSDERRFDHFMYRFRAHLLNFRAKLKTKERLMPKPTKAEAEANRRSWDDIYDEREAQYERLQEYKADRARRGLPN